MFLSLPSPLHGLRSLDFLLPKIRRFLEHLHALIFCSGSLVLNRWLGRSATRLLTFPWSSINQPAFSRLYLFPSDVRHHSFAPHLHYNFSTLPSIYDQNSNEEGITTFDALLSCLAIFASDRKKKKKKERKRKRRYVRFFGSKIIYSVFLYIVIEYI